MSCEQPPKEWIVSDDDLHELIYHSLGTPRDILECRVFSRPHPSPGTPADDGYPNLCDGTREKYCNILMNRNVEAAAKAAREQHATELIEKIEKYLDEREQPKCVVLSLQMVEKLIKKSLRAQQAGEP